MGQAFGHSLGDPNNWAYSVTWGFGGSEIDQSGKVAINSKETLEAVKFTVAAWKDCLDDGGLAWDDSSNNRAYLAGTISATINGASIYFVAKRQFPDIVKVTNHGHMPKGPGGRFYASAVRAARHESTPEPAGGQGFPALVHGPIAAVRRGWRRTMGTWSARTPTGRSIALERIPSSRPSRSRSGGLARHRVRQSEGIERSVKYILVDMYAQAIKGMKRGRGEVGRSRVEEGVRVRRAGAMADQRIEPILAESATAVAIPAPVPMSVVTPSPGVVWLSPRASSTSWPACSWRPRSRS